MRFGMRFLKPILLARMLHKCMNFDVELMRHANMKKEIEEDHLYDFLVGLDPSLDQVRSQVLAQDPLPSVRNAFAFVRREELRQATMMAVKFHDGSAMVAGASSRPLPMVPNMIFDQSAQQVSLANASTSLGKTGALDHMTNDSKLFSLYTTTPRNTVKVANGLSTLVLGAGSIPFSSSLSLSSVLHDILTKKLIGLGRERGGLYYLDLKEAPVLEAGHVYQVGTKESKAREKIWLWHRRLGHRSFQYLQHLFPSLFSKVNNGISERKNRHLLEVALSLCFAMHVPKHFWGDVILTAAFLINRMPRVLQFKTLLRTLSQHHSLPSLLNIPPKVFGCTCYIHVHQHQRGKMDTCARKCLFVGYSATQKGYKCYHPPSGKVFVSMDVTFLEQEAYFLRGASDTSLQGEIGSKEEEKLSWNEMTIPIVSRVEITPPTPSKLPEERELRVYARRKKNQDQDALQDTFANHLSSVSTPDNLQNALGNPKWKSAMVEEMEALQKNSTWDLVELPEGKKTGELEEEVYMDLPPGFTTASDVGKVARSRHGIFLSQQKYVLDLLIETGMLACQPIDTPIEQNHKLGDDRVDQVPTNKERYQVHMDAVHRILRYLKSALGKGLMFSKHGHLEVEEYIDADWVGSITDWKFTSGYFTFVGGNLVTWRSKKQNVVARSSAEAEYRAMLHGVCELLWLRILMGELGFNLEKPVNLYCDNKASISIAHNPVQHDRTKHVEVDRHFIKEKLTNEIISVPFVKYEDQELQNNELSNITGSIVLPPNVTVWLQGNPLCSNANLVQQFCQSENNSHSSTNTTSDSLIPTCPPPYECSSISAQRCVCAAPLFFGYRLQSPGFADFRPYRDQFEVYLTDGLELSLNQLDLNSFAWEEGPRLRMYLKLFPINNTFNSSEVLRITGMFTGVQINLSDIFGPYELLNYTLLDIYKGGISTSSRSGLSKVSLVGIVLGTIVGAVTLSAVVTLLILRVHMRKHHVVSRRHNPSMTSIKIDGVKAFTYGEMALATNNFNSSAQVGQGGYGMVYKGILADGTVVAIKRAQVGSLQGEREFLTEIELLSRLHHRNLVSLTGYCDEEGEQMLVYEFMPNGTLRDHLSANKSKEPLSFAMRLKIALASAKGILYLHTEADPPIFHRDIKASNILLDSKYTTKVADFGLSRLAPVPDLEGTTPGHVSTVVKGTPVSIAQQTGRIYELVDDRMGSYPSECVVKFFTLALKCCEEETDARPSMAEVTRELEGIWLMMPDSDIRTTNAMSSDAEKVMTPPSSSSMVKNPYVSSDVSGSDLVSGVVSIHRAQIESVGCIRT
uniref:Protein kinase domain-containing protein n=1 Tax=Fagus sylvatica TaxID=28930 RepID=A0A2N9IIQ2_FAGSY